MLSVSLHVLLHPGGLPRPRLPRAVGVDEVGLHARLVLDEAARTVQPHHHEGRGVGVGAHAVRGDDGGREDFVLHGVSRPGIHGVGILLPLVVIIVPVVSAGGHGRVGDVQYLLQCPAHGQGVVLGLVDADAPRSARRVQPSGDDFAADVHHIVVHAPPAEQLRHHIDGIALGHGTARQHQPGVVLADAPVRAEAHPPVSGERQQAIHHAAVREGPVAESESPGVDQRGDGDVESPSRLGRHLLAAAEHVGKERVGYYRFVAVDACDDRRVIEGRQRPVEAVQGRLDVLVQVVATLVGHGVDRPEDGACILLVGHGAIMAYQDPDGTEHQEQEPQPVACSLLVHVQGCLG